MKQQKLRIVISLLMLLCWLFFIYGMSAGTGDESAGLSAALASFLYRFPPVPKIMVYDHFHLLIRKTAHFTEYGILSLLVLNFLNACGIALQKTIYMGTILFCGIYAAADEYHQRFVEGRCGTPVDVLIDTAGAITFVSAFFVFRYYRLKSRPKDV